MAHRTLTAELKPHERIILPWDRSTISDPERLLLEKIARHVGMFKVGYQAFTATNHDTTVGFEVGMMARELDIGVFQDWKFKDIQNTVKSAVANIAADSVTPTRIITIHATMRAATIEAAVLAAGDKSLIAGVTLLTDHDEDDADYIYHTTSGSVVTQSADTLEMVAEKTGRSIGIVCAPKELELLEDSRLVRITPGIRDKDAPLDDQNRDRTMTAAEAIAAGADYLVIGRPILNAADPVAAAQKFAAEIASAL